MHYQTRTKTHTLTYTYVDVRHVNWKIRSDLRYLRYMYGLFSERYEEEMSADLYKWVLAGYVSYIEFVFYGYPNMDRILALRYEISAGALVTRDDDAGDIPYVNFPYNTYFNVLVGTNQKWKNSTEVEKKQHYDILSPGWGPSKLHLNENPALWSSDNIYSSNALSVQRYLYK
ncbi:MAG: hypothetical protein WBB67_11980 [bacterium]